MQFDHDGDGQADGAATSDFDGSFSYDPGDLAYGQITIAARTSQWDPLLMQHRYSDWTPYTFTFEPTPVASVEDFALADDTGTSATDGITFDATVTGHVAIVDGMFRVIQFDHDEDGDIDGSVTTDVLGHFSYLPFGLPFEEVTLKARVEEWDQRAREYRHSEWATLTFTLEPSPDLVATVSALSLYNDDGAASDDKVTSDPRLKGEIDGDGLLAFVTVQFDHNADGAVDGVTTTDFGGRFSYSPTGLTYGERTIKARVKEFNTQISAYVYGAWTELAFTYVAPVNIAPTVASLTLVNDTGTSATDGVTTDPRVKGQIANDGSVTALIVEFDHDGDGDSDGTALTDATGKFQYAPLGLPYSSVSIAARVREWDPIQAVQIHGAWTSYSRTRNW